MRESPEPFRFLDLPPELRLMVYELLPNRTVRTEFTRPMDAGASSSFAIITSSVPTVILATCHLIKEEAASIVRSTAKSLLNLDSECVNGAHADAPRIEADLTALVAISGNVGIIPAIFARYQQIQEMPTKLPKIQKSFMIGYMRTFLSIQQYAPNQCTMEEAALRLLDFVRRAGWAIDHQKRLAVSTRASLATSTSSTPIPTSVFPPQIQIGLCLRSEPPARKYRVSALMVNENIGSVVQTRGVLVKVHIFAFDTPGARDENAKRRAIAVWLRRKWDGRPFGHVSRVEFDGAVAVRAGGVRAGLLKPDLTRPKAHARLWKDCEWLD